MARIQLNKAFLIGRLGEIVGSARNSINYVKTYTRPRDPKSPEQLRARTIFRQLQSWALALYRMGIWACIPEAEKKSGQGAVISANKSMLAAKAFNAEALQVASANFSPIKVSSFTASGSASGCSISLAHEWKPGLNFSCLSAHFVVYNGDLSNALTHVPVPLANTAIRSNLSAMDFDLPSGYVKDGCCVYFFIAGTDKTGRKKLLSETFCAVLK